MVKVRIVKVAKIFLKIYIPSFVIALRINKKLNITRISIRPKRLLKFKGARLRKRRRSADCEKIKIIKYNNRKLAVGVKRRWWKRS